MATYGMEGGGWMNSDQRSATESKAESILRVEREIAKRLGDIHHDMWHHVKKHAHRQEIERARRLVLEAVQIIEKAAVV